LVAERTARSVSESSTAVKLTVWPLAKFWTLPIR
jgi:hypothetical protein